MRSGHLEVVLSKLGGAVCRAYVSTSKKAVLPGSLEDGAVVLSVQQLGPVILLHEKVLSAFFPDFAFLQHLGHLCCTRAPFQV